jgi:hypothetical protein
MLMHLVGDNVMMSTVYIVIRVESRYDNLTVARVALKQDKKLKQPGRLKYG